jgi:hypothetical protein
MDDSKDASVKIASDVSVQKAPRRAAEESITFVA